MKKTLIVLGCIIVVLAIVSYFLILSPGTYEFAGSSSTTNASSGLSTLSFSGLANQSGTASGSAQNGSSSGIFPVGVAQSGIYTTNYSYPYVVNWIEGQASFSITSASLDGNQIAFALKVQIGNVGGCIPMNLRLVTDESGDTTAPDQPAFTFPDTQSCNGTPNASYSNQLVTFTISSSTPSPFLFTTGGQSNQFFEVSTSTDGSLDLQLPSTNG